MVWQGEHLVPLLSMDMLTSEWIQKTQIEQAQSDEVLCPK